MRSPDPGDEFRGYANRPVRLPDGRNVASTRNLVRVTGWLAAALIAHEGRRYVVRKRECHALYREVSGDEWGALLEEIYLSCHGRWGYLVPEAPDERAQLRSICTRVLEFENYFLRCFVPFVEHELEAGDETGRARWPLREIPLDDGDVRGFLRKSGPD